MANYIKNNFSDRLMQDIKEELKRIGFGSLEIYVQNNKVTQMTVRNIKKTNVEIQDKKQIRVLTIKKQ